MTDNARIVREALGRIRCASPQDEVAVVEPGVRGVYRPTFSVLAEEATGALDHLESELATTRKALEANRAAVSDACHAIAIYGDQPPQMYLDALAVADAALERINGEGHAE